MTNTPVHQEELGLCAAEVSCGSKSIRAVCPDSDGEGMNLVTKAK